ncbi:unnamed protein product [Amoebophrya sp. A25]|nr:unnamed protein product [Amoebophrya sp. A25]|eukprot:GSA25T00019043001.1
MAGEEGGSSASNAKASHLHFGIAKAGGQREAGPEGHTIELKADEMAAKREAFNAARAQITADIHAKRTIQLPTQDPAVRTKLREYGVPITLFGEGPYERRERLKSIMTGDKKIDSGKTARVDDDQQHEEFFTVGSEALKERRWEIARYSLAAAACRLDAERALLPRRELEEAETDRVGRWLQQSASIELSQVGDERPLTQGRFSPDGRMFATASWTGLVKLWNVPSGSHLRTLRTATETRSHGVCFAKPSQGGGSGPDDAMDVDGEKHASQNRQMLAAAMANGSVCVWNTEQELPVCTLKGHEDRVNRVAFHPSGAGILASTSHDQTWRLWDVEKQTEILCQEGHSTGVYGVAIHPDGSLICTTDLGGIARVWDMRTGRTVFPLQGHHSQILSCDFNKHGFQIMTGSDDNTVRFWDMRKRQCVSTLQAHSKCVSEVQYDASGRFFVSSSYDKTVKLWNANNNHCMKVLVGHEARVMGAALCPVLVQGQHWIGSVAFDRTFKFWATRGQASDYDDRE